MISRTVTRTKISPVRQGRSNPDRRNTSAIDHAVRLVHSVCCLAGAASLIDDIRADLRADGIPSAIRRHDTATLFDWLVAALSYQGISDQVATEYGRPRWADIDAKVAASPTCPKLAGYWHFHGCRYDKISRTCSEPDHIDGCPLPTHQLRNGRLNQMAYSLFLFIRDIADGDLVGWIDRQLQSANDAACYQDWWLRRHYRYGGATDRCAGFQSELSGDVSAVRPACDLAVLRPVWPGRLQRQSD